MVEKETNQKERGPAKNGDKDWIERVLRSAITRFGGRGGVGKGATNSEPPEGGKAPKGSCPTKKGPSKKEGNVCQGKPWAPLLGGTFGNHSRLWGGGHCLGGKNVGIMVGGGLA